MAQLTQIVTDGVTVVQRNLIKVVRVPEILISVLVTPLIMVVMFAYVFGGSMAWIVIIIAVFAPLAVRRYRQAR